MSQSRLGQSLMRTIEGGKARGEEATSDSVVEEAFEQAERNGPSDELIEAGLSSISNDTQQSGEIEDKPSPTEALDKPGRAKPKKLKAPKKKNDFNYVAAFALLVSVGAIGIAGYSIFSQKADQADTAENMESLDTAIGTINTTADELTAALSGTQKDVLANSDRLAAMDLIRSDVASLQMTISTIQGDLEGIKDELGTHAASIESNQQQITELSEQVKKFNARAASAPVQRPAVPVTQSPPVNTNPNEIDGAFVASMDLWGTEPYVMLRERNGTWVPLTLGDYYRGWRLAEVTASESVFQKGSHVKRLTIKE